MPAAGQDRRAGMTQSARVAALYRYPLKGFGPEECASLEVREGGRIEGDRVLALRFANSPAAADAWSSKHECVALVNTPGLARLRVRFDRAALRLQIALGEAVLVDEDLGEPGRKRIAAAVQDHVLTLAENPLAGHPERLPLRLVGDGITPRMQDDPAGSATLHGRASLEALAATIGAPGLDGLRFRSNIVIEGLPAWEEQGWIGREIEIGGVAFRAVKPKVRCLATHANPLTGERDLAVMPALLKAFAAERPTFAIALATAGSGGTIKTGDRVRIEEKNDS
jgi:uncharacterized protein YcbX